MNFLKNLFSGAGAPQEDVLYVYVQPKMCKEVVKVRIDMKNQLSREDDDSGYFVRKTARGQRCPFAAEMLLRFDGNRRLIEQIIENGTFVTEAEYRALYGDEDDA
ncbi:MAG: hypothetical protein KC496_01170 [Anaerolineae bacterium]|nr:hypothetical protein [Anaerolineae bacterium]